MDLGRRQIALVINPRAPASVQQRVMQSLSECATPCAQLETRGDGGDCDRVGRLVRDTRPQVVIAAGGDGTVSEVVQGIMAANLLAPPSLAIIPLGTANNVARSFALHCCRHGSHAAVAQAVATALGGSERRIDLGRVGTRYFIGSLAIGMDADILVTRNRTRQRFGLGQRIGGYPLYLWSCALNLFRRHGTSGRLHVDGSMMDTPVYNLLVTNTPIYAGEFRFDADNTVDDGRLDLHLFTGARDYLRRYPAAWRRHVRYTRGRRVAPPREVRRVREVVIELAAPVAGQLDGEECEPAASYAVRVVPRALSVRVAPT